MRKSCVILGFWEIQKKLVLESTFFIGIFFEKKFQETSKRQAIHNIIFRNLKNV